MRVIPKLMNLGDSGRVGERVVENHISSGTVSHPWKHAVSRLRYVNVDTRMNKLCFENEAKETCHVTFQQFQPPSAHFL
jgi:hypothetical protein